MENSITRMSGEQTNRVQIECTIAIAEKYVKILKNALIDYQKYKSLATFDVSWFVAAKIGSDMYTVSEEDAKILEPERVKIVQKREIFSILKIDVMLSEILINKIKETYDILSLELSLKCIQDDVNDFQTIIENSNGNKFNDDLIKSYNKFPELGAKLNLYGENKLVSHINGLNVRANKIMEKLDELQNCKIKLILSNTACDRLGISYENVSDTN